MSWLYDVAERREVLSFAAEMREYAFYTSGAGSNKSSNLYKHIYNTASPPYHQYVVFCCAGRRSKTGGYIRVLFLDGFHTRPPLRLRPREAHILASIGFNLGAILRRIVFSHTEKTRPESPASLWFHHMLVFDFFAKIGYIKTIRLPAPLLCTCPGGSFFISAARYGHECPCRNNVIF